MPGDDLTQQLAEQIAWRVADVMGWPEWMRARALGRPMTPIVKRVLDAVLASRLVVPTSDVHAAIARVEARGTYSSAMRELRALTQQETP